MGKGYGPRPAKVSGFSADGVRLQPIDISKIRSRLFLRMANSKAYKNPHRMAGEFFDGM